MRFPGVTPALTTPFGADGAVDHDALARSVQRLLGAGMAGFVACGTMGEAQSLSRDERRAVIATVVEAAGGRVPVTAGISSETPALSSGYAADAAAAGASALMLLPSLGYEGDAREIVAFYEAVTASCDLPIMAYNNPKASGTDMPADVILAVAAAVEQVVAIKECSGDARRIARLVHDAGDRLEVLVGGDDWALEGFAAGATGWISGVAVAAPEACHELHERCVAGDLAGARATYARLLPLARLDMTPKLVQFFKAAQDALGHTGGPCRPPRLALSDADRAVLDAALAALAEAPVAA
ncbi:MAG: dihydrodipicolinate synthase family protein [Solirubrobacteraceae bacterium]